MCCLSKYPGGSGTIVQRNDPDGSGGGWNICSSTGGLARWPDKTGCRSDCFFNFLIVIACGGAAAGGGGAAAGGGGGAAVGGGGAPGAGGDVAQEVAIKLNSIRAE